MPSPAWYGVMEVVNFYDRPVLIRMFPPNQWQEACAYADAGVFRYLCGVYREADGWRYGKVPIYYSVKYPKVTLVSDATTQEG